MFFLLRFISFQLPNQKPMLPALKKQRKQVSAFYYEHFFEIFVYSLFLKQSKIYDGCFSNMCSLSIYIYITISIVTIKAPAAAPRVASRSPSIPDMTINALSTLKDRKGHTLAAIRNFISTQHNRVVNKTFQGHIRKFIEKEFLEGRIRMTNSDGEQINFSKRFALAK